MDLVLREPSLGAGRWLSFPKQPSSANPQPTRGAQPQEPADGGQVVSLRMHSVPKKETCPLMSVCFSPGSQRQEEAHHTSGGSASVSGLALPRLPVPTGERSSLSH